MSAVTALCSVQWSLVQANLRRRKRPRPNSAEPSSVSAAGSGQSPPGRQKLNALGLPLLSVAQIEENGRSP